MYDTLKEILDTDTVSFATYRNGTRYENNLPHGRHSGIDHDDSEELSALCRAAELLATISTSR